MSQQNMEQFFYLLDLGSYDLAQKHLQLVEDKEELENYFSILYKGIFPDALDQNKILSYDSFNTNLRLVNQGITYYFKYGNEITSISVLNESLQMAKRRGDGLLICLTLRYILEIYERFHMVINDTSYKDYIVQYKQYAYNPRQRNIAELYEYRIGQRYNFLDKKFIYKSHQYFKNRLASVFKSPFFIAKRDLTFFVHHQDFTNNFDSCNYYLNRTLRILKDGRGYLEKERLLATKINQASLALKMNKPYNCLRMLDNIELSNTDYVYKLLNGYIYDKKSRAYLRLNDSSGYYKNSNLALQFDLEISQGKNARIVSDLATKYQTAEKEKQILEEQQKTRTNRNWLIAATISLLLGAGIAVLLQKNTTKKRLLAEQEAQLRQQRLENVLKEQELMSIDAMIAGQEKERQKVAGELHDDLGSLMATIKLHFDNAKTAKKDPALKHAQKLLDEAYQKIRGMAHSKNSGVMSDQGLLPALTKMARTISGTKVLDVKVEAFGLGERMENSLELSIFRMVQELVANAIKHAEASKVTIQLTQHEDTLNIIVEDNGKGFSYSKNRKNNMGMGLVNIEKRVEHLEGNFTVDSVLGRGTSILIDMPV